LKELLIFSYFNFKIIRIKLSFFDIERCFPQITLMNADQIEVFCEDLRDQREIGTFQNGLCLGCIKAL